MMKFRGRQLQGPWKKAQNECAQIKVTAHYHKTKSEPTPVTPLQPTKFNLGYKLSCRYRTKGRNYPEDFSQLGIVGCVGEFIQEADLLV